MFKPGVHITLPNTCIFKGNTDTYTHRRLRLSTVGSTTLEQALLSFLILFICLLKYFINLNSMRLKVTITNKNSCGLRNDLDSNHSQFLQSKVQNSYKLWRNRSQFISAYWTYMDCRQFLDILKLIHQLDKIF